MLVHTGQTVAGLPARVTELTDAGAHGVQLFFVASAFTLFASLHRRARAEAHPTLNFFLRRVFRIAPPFWLAILFYLWWKGTGPQYWAPHGISWRDVAATAAFAHGWTPTTINSVVPGGWSIAVEMSFYLLVPALFTRLTSLRRCVWFFVACVIGQAVLNAAMRPVFWGMLADDEKYLAGLMHNLWLPTQLPVFAAGFALYYAVAPYLGRAADARPPSPPSARPSAALALVFAAAVVAELYLAPRSTFWGSVFAILAAGLALRPTRLLVNAATRYLGEISYSGYLVHFAVLDIAARVIRHFLRPVTPHPVLFLTLLYAAVVLGSTAVATVARQLVEEPARLAGRRVVAALERRSAVRIVRDLHDSLDT